MHKNIKNFSLFLLSFLAITLPLQAVGGKEAELVTDEEIKRKGVLRIEKKNYADTIAVLFKGSQGHMGLSLKNSFQEHNPQQSCFAYLGAQKRRIADVLKHKEGHLALLVFESPFEGVDDLPQLPTSKKCSLFMRAACMDMASPMPQLIQELSLIQEKNAEKESYLLR